MKTLRAKAFPNGEVRFTMFTPVSRQSKQSHDETGCENEGSGDASPLDIRSKLKTAENVSSEEKELKPGHGMSGTCKTFTSNGRRRLLRAGGAIDSVISKPEECLFLTGTLPGGTEAAKRAIAEWSSYAVNLVQAWLAKRVPEKLLMYSWEFQKRGALHLHLTMVCRDEAIASEIIGQWKKQWERVIDAITRRSGVNCWEREDGYDYSNGRKHVLQTDAQRCNKSAAAYISKYLSKTHIAGDKSYKRDYHPARYWGISRPLCTLLDSMTETVEVNISSDEEAMTVYQDYLSVAESASDCAYNWKARVGTAVAAVAYRKENYQEELWAPLKSRLMESSRFSFVNSTLKETSLEYAATKTTQSICDSVLLLSARRSGQKALSTMTTVERVIQDLTSTRESEKVRGLSSSIDLLSSFTRFKDCPWWVRSSVRESEQTLNRIMNHDAKKAGKEIREVNTGGGLGSYEVSGAGRRVGGGDGAMVRQAATVSFYQLGIFMDQERFGFEKALGVV